MKGLGQELRLAAKRAYDNALNSIEEKVKNYDDIKKIGELWVQRGYYRTYRIDRSTPYYLHLKTGPQETLLCPIVNPFIEELEELGYSLGKAEIDGTIVTIPIIKKDSIYAEYSNIIGKIHIIPARPDRCIRVEETEKVETTKVVKSSMIC